jgi:GMP synthase (glutamine-hydrolysing)
MAKIKEIPLPALQPKEFIMKKIEEINADVKDGIAINALSGGVDSSVVTMQTSENIFY